VRYYGYRFYSAEMGRWINRDPIEEMGASVASFGPVVGAIHAAQNALAYGRSGNTMGFVDNNPVSVCDYLGFKCCASPEQVEIVGMFASLFAAKKTSTDFGYNNVRNLREYCGLICCTGSEVFAALGDFGPYPSWGTVNGIWQIIVAKCFPNRVSSCGAAEEVGVYHSHPRESDFSDDDRESCSDGRPYVFLGLPSGAVMQYNCKTKETIFIEGDPL
jgi:RHS repeat-associated protein